jgi:hypothetical protein
VNISDQTRLRPANKLPGRSIAGETVVVDPRRRKVFLLNGVAGVVWSGVERQASVREILDDVVTRYEVEEHEARADLERFVGELEAAGLLERAA